MVLSLCDTHRLLVLNPGIVRPQNVHKTCVSDGSCGGYCCLAVAGFRFKCTATQMVACLDVDVFTVV